jgi:hypothetical protein
MLLMAQSGYLLQSWAIGTTILELSYSIAYISSDEERATRWIEHTDMARPPWSTKTAARAAAKAFDNPAVADKLYERFRQLSAAKHGNPMILTRYGVSALQPGTKFQFDPHYSRATRIMSQLGLLYCVSAIGLAMWAFAKHHSDDAKIVKQMLLLMQRTNDLMSGLDVSGK